MKSARLRYRLALNKANELQRSTVERDSAEKRKASEKLAELEERQKQAKLELDRVTQEMQSLQK